MTSGPTSSTSSSSTRTEVIVDNIAYDVTDFMRRHPGGSVIGFFHGSDASLAWHEFHARSKKASKILKSLPSRALNSQESEAVTSSEGAQLSKDFMELRRQFEQEGLFDPSLAHVAYRYTELLLMFGLGFVFMHYDWTFTGLVVLGIASGRSGWLMHEAGHYSLTGEVKRDKLLQELTYGFGIGLSGAYWRNQHNKVRPHGFSC